ncbi:hypothetical protein [Enterococcus sp. AZ102]|uniref:hypothetical protein n=1 Tax=Enterococcus sp. AZ102 TaxID=2774865 RepID=UPI003F1FBA5E
MGKGKSKVKKKKRKLEAKAIENGTLNKTDEKKKVVKRIKRVFKEFSNELGD